MGRPEYLNCVMPPEIIRSIRQSQKLYDEDPAEYERREREKEEEEGNEE